MTNRNLTALILRIAGIYLFTKIFDHFGSYFFSVYATAAITNFDELLNTPIGNFVFKGTFLSITNICMSLFLFIKADWISKKLIKTDSEIKTELNPKSLSKVILLTVGIIWLAQLIYIIPDFINYCTTFVMMITSDEYIQLPNFAIANYLLKLILTLLIIFKIEKISHWIINKI